MDRFATSQIASATSMRLIELSKKVLIVTDINHASPRIPGLTKYLGQYGWDATVISPPSIPALTRYHPRLNWLRPLRPFRNFAARRYHELFDYPDGHRRLLKKFVDAGYRALRKARYDLLLSSSSPVTSHLAAKQLKQQFHIPWIADFRDLWSRNAAYPYTPLRRAVDWRLEQKTIQEADCLVTVSKPLADTLRKQHGKPVYSVPNAFDPEDRKVGTHLTDKFTITYTGQIYSQQDPTRLLVALEHLIHMGTINREDVAVRFYGPRNYRICQAVESLGLNDVVSQLGFVSHEQVLARQRESQVLLVLKWEDPKERGIYCGKTFEYMMAERPILATGGYHDVTSDLIAETQVGLDAHSTYAVEVALMRFYREYKAYGKTRWWGIPQEIAKHSFVEMARRYAEVMNNN